MRAIILTALGLISLSSAFAGEFTVKFHCQAGEVSSIHRFEMVGEALTNCEGLEILASEVTLYRAKSQSPTMQLSDVYLLGSLKHFAPGELTAEDVFQLKSSKQEGEIQAANILLNYPAGYSSSIRAADGYNYRAKCSIVP